MERGVAVGFDGGHTSLTGMEEELSLNRLDPVDEV